MLIEQLTFVNSALQISIFNEQSLWNKLFRENIKTFLLFPMKFCWHNTLIQKTPKTPKHRIGYRDTTPWHHWQRSSAHRKSMQEVESQSDYFSWENYVFLALLATRELRKTSRDSRPASREAGAHRKLSKDKRANTFPFTEGSGRAGACAKLPCSELTPRNPNPSESRALPACGLTTAQWHV